MKKYNSVFTIAVSIDHDREDAEDVTKNDVYKAVKRRLKDIMNDGPFDTLVTGPDATYENT